LIGRYEKYDDVPLGIKAVVTAIYEPPQESSATAVRLLDDENSDKVDALCSALGQQRVGWIFTDLAQLQSKTPGAVRYTRTPDSYHLTAQECITAGAFQNRYRNVCRYAQEHYFGSKFATVVVTGDVSNMIHMVGYQVSNQCDALVEAQLLVPVNGRPELGFIRSREHPAYPDQYVPDVQYKLKDEYGNEVTRDGRPLPVEYLLVDVPVGAPLQSTRTLAGEHIQYAIENRNRDMALFPPQDLSTLNERLSKNSKVSTIQLLANWHLLYQLCTQNASMPHDARMSDDELLSLVNACGKADSVGVDNWTGTCMAYSAIIAHATSARSTNKVAGGRSTSDDEAQWQCASCTFLNPTTKTDCDICGLPRHR